MSGLAGIISLKKDRRNKEIINILLDKISYRGKKRKVYNICGNYIGINANYKAENRVSGEVILLDGINGTGAKKITYEVLEKLYIALNVIIYLHSIYTFT
ncbi:MAG: hypothetical protein FJW63_06320 [Actinobacteria bacterium]|nr:hypothetical protein [Actinomycetota bacterium]